MDTHTKEAVATLVGFFGIVAVVHAGIWFHLFGVPDVRILGYPFHYFWFVAGAPVALFVAYGIYYRYITTRIRPEKARLHEESAAGGDADGSALEEAGE